VITTAGAMSVLSGAIVLLVPQAEESRTFAANCPGGVCTPETAALGAAAGERADLLQVLGWSLISGGTAAALCGLGWNLNEYLRRPAAPSARSRVSLGVGLDGTLRVGGVF
jgi:hypothetical protein